MGRRRLSGSQRPPPCRTGKDTRDWGGGGGGDVFLFLPKVSLQPHCSLGGSLKRDTREVSLSFSPHPGGQESD